MFISDLEKNVLIESGEIVWHVVYGNCSSASYPAPLIKHIFCNYKRIFENSLLTDRVIGKQSDKKVHLTKIITLN